MAKRPIKFKGWTHRIGKMIDLQLITPLALNGDIKGLFLPDDDQVTLLQFTGQLDDQGKEIYEGDIVVDHMDFDSVAEVVYDQEEAAFVIYAEGSWEYLDGETLTVVGNAFENRSLLSA